MTLQDKLEVILLEFRREQHMEVQDGTLSEKLDTPVQAILSLIESDVIGADDKFVTNTQSIKYDHDRGIRNALRATQRKALRG